MLALALSLVLGWGLVRAGGSCAAPCAPGSACSAGVCAACSPATACPVAGLAAQPPCYWNVSVLAGSGAYAWADGLGTAAAFNGPHGVAVDPSGAQAVLVGDWKNHRLRRVTLAGAVTTLAGSGSPAFADGLGAAASFHYPFAVAVGTLSYYLADAANHRLRLVSPAGSVSTLAGSVLGSLDGTGTAAQLNYPTGVALSADGSTAYVVEQDGCRVRAIALASALVSTLAGSGACGFADGAGASAQFSAPTSVVWHPSGALYVGEFYTHRIRRVDLATAAVTTLAGSAVQGGSDGVGSAATFSAPRGVALDASARVLYLSESGGHRIRALNLSTGEVRTIAGSTAGAPGYANGFGTAAAFFAPIFLAVAPDGVIYTPEYDSNRVRQLACVPCPAAYYCASGGPEQCPPGHFCPPYSVAATPCPAGSASPATGAASNATCAPCPPGRFSAAGAAVCSPCPAGVYGSAAGLASPSCSGNCSAPPGAGCAAGSTSPANATQCAPGLFCPGGSPAPALPCAPASACPTPGLASPPPCAWSVTTLAGSGAAGAPTDGPALAARLSGPHGVAVDPATQALLFSDNGDSRVRRVTPGGVVVTLAGSGVPGFADGQGAAAAFQAPLGLAIDAQGVALVCDFLNHRIRLVSPAGAVTTLAGSGVAGGGNGRGTAAQFSAPAGIALARAPDGSGAAATAYVAEQGGCRVRAIDLGTAAVSTLAGSGVSGYANGAGTAAQLSSPSSVAWHPSGALYVGGFGNSLRRIDLASGAVGTLAGSEAAGGADGVGSAATFASPRGVALDASGSVLYVAEMGGGRLRAVALDTGAVRTLAGGGAAGFGDGYGTAARFFQPIHLAASAASGALFVADFQNDRIRQLTCEPCPASYFCASGAPVLCPAGSFCPRFSLSATPCPAGSASPDTGAASNATCARCPPGRFSAAGAAVCSPCPAGVYGSAAGLASPSCSGNCSAPPGAGCAAGSTSPANATQCAPGLFCPGGSPAPALPCAPATACPTPGLASQPPCFWRVSTLAGNGSAAWGDGPGAAAALQQPHGVTVDPASLAILIGDLGNDRVRRLSPAGLLATLAGSGRREFADGLGAAASFDKPTALVVDARGVALVADAGTNRVRLVSPAGLVTTLAGNAIAGGGNGIGTAASFWGPTGVALAGDGSSAAYVVEQVGCRVRAIDLATAVVSTLAGSGACGYADGSGTSAQFNGPTSAAWHPSGVLYVGEIWTNRVRRLELATGLVSTLAGSGAEGGGDGVGTLATLHAARGVALDAGGGVLYVSEQSGHRLRAVDLASGAVRTIAGSSGAAGFRDGYGAAAAFYIPLLPAVSPSDVLLLADNGNHRLRQLACVPCPPAHACDTGAPLLCPPGAYCAPSNGTAATTAALLLPPPTPCPAGRFSAAPGATSSAACSQACPLGHYCPPGSAAPLPCPPGVYGAAQGLADSACSGACSAPPGAGCAAGSTSPANATQCAPGHYCPGGSPAPALPCAPATACPAPGLASQPQCFWNVSTLAGSRAAGRADGQGAAAAFYIPHGVAVDSAAEAVFVADFINQVVRRVSFAGVTTTIAGSGAITFTDGLGTSAAFNYPIGVAVGPEGALLVADTSNHRIRTISPEGRVSTVAGGSAAGASNGIGSVASFTGPTGIALAADGSSTAYIAEQAGCRLRVLHLSSALVTALAGNGTCAFLDGSGTGALFNGPSSAAWHPSGLLFVGDVNNFRVRRVDLATGVVNTFAGNGSAGGSDGAGTLATFSAPRGVALGAGARVLYVSEFGGHRIRAIDVATALVTTIAGSPSGAEGYADGFGTAAALRSPVYLDASRAGVLYVADGFNHCIRQVTCVPCPAAYFCASGGPVLCPAGSACPFASLTPAQCPPGTFSAAGAAACTPCPCPAACAVAGLSAAPSCSASPSPSPSPTPSRTPSPTPTPSTTPPPFACTSAPNGCLAPAWLTPPPPPTGAGGGGAPLPPAYPLPAPLLASWPALVTRFSVALPRAPSLGEAATLSCAVAPAGAGALAVAAPPQALPCSPPAPACQAVPSAAAAGEAPPAAPALRLSFTLAAAANASGALAAVGCTLFSAPLALSAAAGLPYPNYGRATALPPLAAAAAPFSLPLLAAVLRESSATPGALTLLGGSADSSGGSGGSGSGSGGAPYTLPAPSALADACAGAVAAQLANLTAAASPSPWTLPAVVLRCPAALAALAALHGSLALPQAAASTSSAPAGFLAGSLSGSRHLLLLASPLTPFTANLTATLGGAPCALNWATPTVASITTPPLAALCANASLGSDCGLAPLVLAHAASGAAAASAPPFLPLPAAYPPLLPTADWGPQLAALAEDPALASPAPLSQASALIGLPPRQLLAAAAALAPEGTGLRIVPRCSDPAYAPPEQCAVVAGAQPLLNASAGLQCVWGSGEACLPCPAGALCPGGTVLLPLAGYWAPAVASPPSDLYACPDPDATARCPGYAAVPSSGGAYGCGVGFRGQLCAACAAAYFPLRGSCAPCPAFSLRAFLAPLLVFAAGLAAFGAAMTLLVYATLRWRSGGSAAVSLRQAAEPVADLVLWTWIAAQGLASLFSQTQALAPPALGPFFTAVSALQFQGIALDPACYSSIPFATFYASLSAFCSLYALSGLALCALRRWPAPSDPAAPTAACSAPALATSALTLCALALSVAYGALTSEFAAALVCTVASPMSVRDYLQTANDGSTLLAQRRSLAPSALPALLAASRNPLLAASSGLSAALASTLQVSVLASDPYSVCGEGAHRAVRPLAALCVAALTLALPLGGLVVLWRVGRLKCLQRRAPRALQRLLTMPLPQHTQQQQQHTQQPPPPPPPPRPLSLALTAALADAALLRRSEWYTQAAQLQLALVTGLIAASRARLPLPLYLACQGAIAAASACGAALVARAQLYTPAQAWKRPVVALLNGVTGLTAVLNAALVAAGGGSGGGGASSRAIVALPLACAAATLVTLLVSWWRSLQMPVASGKPAPAPAPGPAAPASLARAAAAAALLAQWWRQRRAALRPPRESAAARLQWRRWVDDDGDCFWYQPSSGASAWEVPRGGDTACGWRWVGSSSGGSGSSSGGQPAGHWVHWPSQCVSAAPPPVSEGGAAALIERHAAAQVVALRVQREPEPAPAPLVSEAQRREALQRLSGGQPGGRWGRERAGVLFGVLAELGGSGAGAAGAAEGGGGSGSAGGGAAGGAEARALVGHLVERSLRHDEQQQARQQARQGRHFASGWAPRE